MSSHSGVIFASLGSGLGEITYLSLTPFFGRLVHLSDLLKYSFGRFASKSQNVIVCENVCKTPQKEKLKPTFLNKGTEITESIKAGMLSWPESKKQLHKRSL